MIELEQLKRVLSLDIGKLKAYSGNLIIHNQNLEICLDSEEFSTDSFNYQDFILIGLNSPYNCTKISKSEFIAIFLHEFGHFLRWESKECYSNLNLPKNLRDWIEEVKAWELGIKVLKMLRIPVNLSEFLAVLINALLKHAEDKKIDDKRAISDISYLAELLEEKETEIEDFPEKDLEKEPIPKKAKNHFPKIKVFRINPIKREKDFETVPILEIEEILKEKRLREFSFYKDNNILKVSNKKKPKKKGRKVKKSSEKPYIVKRGKLNVEISIMGDIFALLSENKISLGSKRQGQPIPEDFLENEIENILEHEFLHILLKELENVAISNFFDIIEYQTNAVWKKEIPLEFLSTNKTDKSYSELKMAKFLTFYKYLTNYQKYLAFNKLLEIKLYAEKVKDKSLFHKELYEKCLEYLKETENNPFFIKGGK